MKMTLLLLMTIMCFNCSVKMSIQSLVSQEYGKDFRIIDAPENSNYQLILGKVDENNRLYPGKVDFMIIEIASKSIIYKRTLNLGSVEWLNKDELLIKEHPRMPMDDSFSGSSIYNIEQNKLRHLDSNNKL